MSRLSLVPKPDTPDMEMIKFSYSMSSFSEISSGKYHYILKPWTSDDLARCYSISSAIYADLLPRIAKALAVLNKQPTIEMRSWETLIGWWLASTIDIIVARSFEISSVKDKLDGYEIPRVNWDGFLPTSHHLFDLYNDGQFNGWLMSAIQIANFNLDKIKFPDISEFFTPKKNEPLVDKFWTLVPGASEILVGESIGRLNCFKIMMRSRKKTSLVRTNPIAGSTPNSDYRKKLIEILEPRDARDEFLLRLLTRLLPTSLLEDFNYYLNTALNQHPKAKCIIYSSSEVVHNDLFKFVAVVGRKYFNSIVIGQQHGGAYGTSRLHRSTEIESRCVDIWLSWGRFGGENTRPIKSQHLEGFSRNFKNDKKGDVLVILNNYPRFTYWLYDCPQGPAVAKWFLFIAKFLKEIDISSDCRFRVRPYHACLDWGQKTFIASTIQGSNKIEIDSQKSIRDSIRRARLVITLSNGTTWLESMYANVPTIALLPEQWWSLNPNFSDIFAKMREQNLLAFNSEDLVKFMKSDKFRDINSWWNSYPVQSSRLEFLRAFCNFEA